MKDAMQMGWDERTVTVNRKKLLETLYTNLKKHKSDYVESVAGYKETATATLNSQIAKARKAIEDSAAIIAMKIEKFDPSDPPSNQMVVLAQHGFTLEVPQDHSKSYEVAIKMAEWEVSDTIELTQSQFQCFVMDDWDWKQSFDTLNTRYSKKF